MAVQTMMIDTGHSTVELAVTYAMNSIIKGRFLRYSGTITIDTEDPASSSVTAEIDTSSLTTDNPERDDDLKGANFFDTQSGEPISFASTSIDVVESGHWNVSGDLTMHGHTRPVTLDTRFYGLVEDANGTIRAGFVAQTDLHRSDWGLTWNADQETGVLISDRVRVSLYISAIPTVDAQDEPDTDDIGVGADEPVEPE